MKDIITKKMSMSEHVYKQIKRMILHLEIKPGERVPEERITEIVNCSRTPVREALRKLDEEGLVTIYPGRYSEVTNFDKEVVKKIAEVRLSQEILSCQLAILHGSNSDFAILKEIAEKCEESARNGNVYERISYDTQFHLQIAKIGGNEILMQNQEKLYQKIHLIQISRYTNIKDSIAQVSQHIDIIDALYNRDYKRIRNLLCIHLEQFYEIDQEIIDMYLSQ